MSSLTLDHLTIHFGAFKAVNDVSFSVKEGELVSLLGPSGCGKSTVLRAIAGLFQPSAGTIRVGTQIVNDISNGIFVPPERRQLGMVFQSYAIWPHMSVFENVAYPLVVRKASKAEIEDRVHKILKLVSLDHLAKRPATELSGGQQQRIAIARSLVFEPKVLLMDEPLSNLDTKLRLRMGLELKRIQERTGVTTIYVTHDQNEALALSEKIIVMRNGRIQQVGSPSDVYDTPQTPFVGWFIGSSNFIPAKLVERQGSLARVALDHKGIEIVVRLAAEHVPDDGSLIVCARPEHIKAVDKGSESAVQVEVLSGAYLGERRQWMASLGDHSIEFFTPPNVVLQKAKEAHIAFADGALTAFPRAQYEAFD
jgi:iron(III) transport system ATP-binding protein